MKYRDRVSYEVRGLPNSEAFPYIDGIATLKQAIAIAKTYPGVYRDGAATHVVRRYSKEYPRGHEFHQCSGLTHRWRVDACGKLQLIGTYSRGWPLVRLSVAQYVARLPRMRHKANSLRGQLIDLAQIAGQIGLADADQALTWHVYGQRRLPDFCGFFKDQAQMTQSQINPAPASKTDAITWREVLALCRQSRQSRSPSAAKQPATPAPSCADHVAGLLGSAMRQLRRILAKFTRT